MKDIHINIFSCKDIHDGAIKLFWHWNNTAKLIRDTNYCLSKSQPQQEIPCEIRPNHEEEISF